MDVFNVLNLIDRTNGWVLSPSFNGPSTLGSGGLVSYASPAASADSMFCNKPRTLKRPTARITDR